MIIINNVNSIFFYICEASAVLIIIALIVAYVSALSVASSPYERMFLFFQSMDRFLFNNDARPKWYISSLIFNFIYSDAGIFYFFRDLDCSNSPMAFFISLCWRIARLFKKFFGMFSRGCNCIRWALPFIKSVIVEAAVSLLCLHGRRRDEGFVQSIKNVMGNIIRYVHVLLFASAFVFFRLFSLRTAWWAGLQLYGLSEPFKKR